MATNSPHYVEREIEDPFGEVQTVLVNLRESPLLWLYSRQHISDRLYQAGELLCRDWEASGLEARVTMRWDIVPPDHSGGANPLPDPGARRLAARERLHAAFAKAGPGLSDILWRVVCAGEGLTSAEQALGWPSRAGKLVLTLALERVALFYRVE